MGRRHVLVVEVEHRIAVFLVGDLAHGFIEGDILGNGVLCALIAGGIEVLAAGGVHIDHGADVGMGQQEVGIGPGLGVGEGIIARALLLVLRLPADGIVAVEVVAEGGRRRL